MKSPLIAPGWALPQLLTQTLYWKEERLAEEVPQKPEIFQPVILFPQARLLLVLPRGPEKLSTTATVQLQKLMGWLAGPPGRFDSEKLSCISLEAWTRLSAEQVPQLRYCLFLGEHPQGLALDLYLPVFEQQCWMLRAASLESLPADPAQRRQLLTLLTELFEKQ